MFNGFAWPAPTTPAPAPTTPAPTAPPPYETVLASQPYLSFRRALDAAHVRTAGKGLWTKYFIAQNKDWQGLVYDSSCPPVAERYPFPAATGKFAALLKKGIKIAYFNGSWAMNNGTTNPPTGVEPSYIKAMFSEMVAVYGPIDFIWVSFNSWSEAVQAVKARQIDLLFGSHNGYITPVPSFETRDDLFLKPSCSLYVLPLSFATLSSSLHHNFEDVVIAESNVTVGVWGGEDFMLKAFAPQAKVFNITYETQFDQALKHLVDKKFDILWNSNVVQGDLFGQAANYTLSMFKTVPAPYIAINSPLTLLDLN